MANSLPLNSQSLTNRFRQYRHLLVPIVFIGMLSMIVVPMPPMLMDLMIAANIALATIILLTTIFVAPASMLFSSSSLTTLAGRSITSPAAIMLIIFLSRTAIFAIETLSVYKNQSRPKAVSSILIFNL